MKSVNASVQTVIVRVESSKHMTQKHPMTKPFKVKIDKGIRLPPGHQMPDSERGRLRVLLKSMKAGESFIWDKDSKPCYDAAKKEHIKIAGRKLNGIGYRIWKVKP